MVEAERVTEPGLAAVSGSGESRGFEGREPEPSPTAGGSLQLLQLSRQQLLWLARPCSGPGNQSM